MPGPAPGEADSDLVLMAALVKRRPEALATLYDRHAGLVMAFCLRVLRDHAEAEQLTLDVFHELWERADRFNPQRSQPRTYLMTVCRSRAIDRLRRRRSSQEARGTGGDGFGVLDGRADPSAGEPLDGLLQDEQRARIDAALGALSEPERRAVELSFFDDLSHREIADALGLPLGTVKTRIRRGLLKLRDGVLRRERGGEQR
ncbi:RNA polymerase ECF-type sigma factor [Phycisphaera mikurensis NBRC 102666]|uniref:RNA polymerase ECF-type sigma factor n=2 Tax=Phycisphaera TaxID=666508 RepID=I0ID37_PHYMF|nr:RNA polymerase ECF-type sigma factor [Phycisphaera mikurensis NBRC 102666]